MKSDGLARSLGENALTRLSGLSADMSATKALALRSNIVAMVEAAEAAALRPGDTGGLSHSLRAAIACRVSRLNGHVELSRHFSAGVGADDEPLCDPNVPGETDRLRAMLSFTDMIATTPRDAEAADIETLQQTGISDADIVRLCELTAFLAFQYRVIAGLSLMKETA